MGSVRLVVGWRWYSAPRGRPGTQALSIFYLHSLGPRNQSWMLFMSPAEGRREHRLSQDLEVQHSTYLHSLATPVSEVGKSISAMGPEGKETGLAAHRAFQSRVRALS